VDQPEPGRRLEYAADQVYIDFGRSGSIEKITGEGHARMASTERTSRTTVSARRFNLEFDAASEPSLLRRSLAEGEARVESVPLATKGSAGTQTRVLRSEGIELLMEPGGREIQSLRTQAPGVIEFIPNQPDQSRRRLEGERIWIAYGPENRIRSLDATNAATRTEPPRPAGKPAPPPTLTWSKQLRAEFDTQGRELAQLDQWGDFRYEQGDRRGRAERAVFAASENQIRLTGSARFWDRTGSLSAGRILMYQDTGDIQAEENVATTREPDSKGQPTAVFTATEPLHG
jgi:lipopolysaccharide export system protein LptA